MGLEKKMPRGPTPQEQAAFLAELEKQRTSGGMQDPLANSLAQVGSAAAIPGPGWLKALSFVEGLMPRKDRKGPYEEGRREAVVPRAEKAARREALSAARSVLARRKGTALDRRINARDTVYHATQLENASRILDVKNIHPFDYQVDALNPPGVSLSRTPGYGYPVTFELSAKGVPPTRPHVYRNPGEGVEYGKNNPAFEFQAENRTKGKSVSTAAIKRLLIDKSVFKPYDVPRQMTALEALIQRAKRLNIPVSFFDRTRQLKAARAELARRP